MIPMPLPLFISISRSLRQLSQCSRSFLVDSEHLNPAFPPRTPIATDAGPALSSQRHGYPTPPDSGCISRCSIDRLDTAVTPPLARAASIACSVTKDLALRPRRTARFLLLM